MKPYPFFAGVSVFYNLGTLDNTAVEEKNGITSIPLILPAFKEGKLFAAKGESNEVQFPSKR